RRGYQSHLRRKTTGAEPWKGGDGRSPKGGSERTRYPPPTSGLRTLPLFSPGSVSDHCHSLHPDPHLESVAGVRDSNLDWPSYPTSRTMLLFQRFFWQRKSANPLLVRPLHPVPVELIEGLQLLFGLFLLAYRSVSLGEVEMWLRFACVIGENLLHFPNHFVVSFQGQQRPSQAGRSLRIV